jgi:tRNA A37 N6-isopentenylltransferase MiaA
MWNNGLLKETVQLLEMGYSENLNALNTVGYKNYPIHKRAIE